MKDGTVFNPAPVCQVPKCPDETSARMIDLTVEDSKRKDLCAKHALVTKRVFKQDVEIVAAWNKLSLDDFDDD